MIDGTPARFEMLISMMPRQPSARLVLLEVKRRADAERHGDERRDADHVDAADKRRQNARLLGSARRIAA